MLIICCLAALAHGYCADDETNTIPIPGVLIFVILIRMLKLLYQTRERNFYHLIVTRRTVRAHFEQPKLGQNSSTPLLLIEQRRGKTITILLLLALTHCTTISIFLYLVHAFCMLTVNKPSFKERFMQERFLRT